MVDTSRMRPIPDSVGDVDPQGLVRKVSSIIFDLFGERVPAGVISVIQRDEIVYADLTEAASPQKEFGYAIASEFSSHPHLEDRMGSLAKMYTQTGYRVALTKNVKRDLLAFSYSRERKRGAC